MLGNCKMCNTTKIINIEGKLIRVDKCMANIITFLNKKGIKTLGCCCGHFIYPPSIVVKDSKGHVKEIFSNKEICRKKKFYLQGKGGFYFIPEATIY